MSYLNPTEKELRDYLLDEYGICIRPAGPNDRNDCFWGKDARGNDDGCLKTGWKGSACPYWKPLGEDEIDAIRQAYFPKDAARKS